MRRTIREVEPIKPSTRLTQELVAADVRRLTSKSEGGDPKSEKEIRATSRRLLQEVRGDLDWIVMKCLEKDRARRYETANGLATDVQRHLNNEPVVACPPRRLYRLRKTVQRNKLAFGAATAVMLALAIGFAVSTAMFFKAQAEKRNAQAEKKKAQTEAAKSQQVAQFLKDMINGVGPWVSQGRDTTLLREIADVTAERIDRDLKHQPEVQAELLDTVGYIYCETGPVDKAETMQRESLAIRKKLFGHEDLSVANTLHNLGLTLWRREKLDEAESVTREALAIRRKLLGDNDPQVATSLVNLGGILLRRGKLTEAEAVEREALQIRKKLNDDAGVMWALEFLGQILDAEGKFDEAEVTHREAIAIEKKTLGSDHPMYADSLRFLGYTLHHAHKLAEAESILRESLAVHRKVSDQKRGITMAWVLTELAYVLNEQGKYDEAESLLREALLIHQLVSGENDPATTNLVAFLSGILKAQGKQVEADALLKGQTSPLSK